MLDEETWIHELERLLCREKFQILQERAIALLSARPGLALTRLWPPSTVIQIVTLDGVHLGRIRRESASDGREDWYAVASRPESKAHGPYPSAWVAAENLAVQAMCQRQGQEHERKGMLP